MLALFTRPGFTSFGPDGLHSPEEIPKSFHVEGVKPRDLRSQLRKACSQRPGVYGMIDAHGDLIYVGKAKRLRTRLLSYFRKRGRDPKARRIIHRTVKVMWEPSASEFAALLRELELIQRWRPRYNVQGQPGLRRRTYVCVGRPPAPHVYLCRKPTPKAMGCFGPVFSGTKTREAVRHLNDLFQLRDCPSKQTMVFADHAGLFSEPRSAGCIRLELATCLGPCAAACTQTAYRRKAREAAAFLKGGDDSILEKVQGDMLLAATTQAFERAARLRDKLDSLRGLREQLDRVRRWQERFSFVYRLGCEEGVEHWYAIHRGRVLAVTSNRASEASQKQFIKRLRGLLKLSPSRLEPVPPGEMDTLLIVAGWFRKYPLELKNTMDVRAAMRLLVRPTFPAHTASASAAG